VDDVGPSILADIEDHATCTVEAFLKGLLTRCLPEEHRSNAPGDLLDQCINAVLPICNSLGHPITTKGTKKRAHEEAQADGLALRKYLTE
jgi:hypothetical protein